MAPVFATVTLHTLHFPNWSVWDAPRFEDPTPVPAPPPAPGLTVLRAPLLLGTLPPYFFFASSSLFPPTLRSLRWSEPEPLAFHTSVTAREVVLVARSFASHFAQTMGWTV